MQQRTMRENLEITEIHRDHLVQAAVLNVMAPMVQEPEIRTMLQRHAQQFASMASRLSQYSNQEPGIQRWRQITQQVGQSAPSFQAPATQGWSSEQNWGRYQTWGQAGTGGMNQMTTSGTFQGQAHLPGEVAAAQCLAACKYLAEASTRAAGESADPQLRHTFHQMCGEHLHMAEELFQVLHQRGDYPMPQAQAHSQGVYGVTGTSGVSFTPAFSTAGTQTQYGQTEYYGNNQQRY